MESVFLHTQTVNELVIFFHGRSTKFSTFFYDRLMKYGISFSASNWQNSFFFRDRLMKSASIFHASSYSSLQFLLEWLIEIKFALLFIKLYFIFIFFSAHIFFVYPLTFFPSSGISNFHRLPRPLCRKLAHMITAFVRQIKT